MTAAMMVLEDGRVFRGSPFGAEGQTLGEAVFCTAMTGYQETLTDPSYHRRSWWPPRRRSATPAGTTRTTSPGEIWVAGYAVRDPARRASNWRATTTLQDELVRQGVVGIAGIDTRAWCAICGRAAR